MHSEFKFKIKLENTKNENFRSNSKSAFDFRGVYFTFCQKLSIEKGMSFGM